MNLSLLIGRNNSGKTSFIMALDKFLKTNTVKFNFDDFPISIRKKILDFNKESDLIELSIRLQIEIIYEANDNLEHLSSLLLDLAPTEPVVKILFECTIRKNKLLEDLEKINDRKDEFIKKYLIDYLETTIYVYEDDNDIFTNREKLVKKDRQSIDNLINYQVIHAKRNVSSSESEDSRGILSALTTKYFNSQHELSFDELTALNTSVIKMDETLNQQYEDNFSDFLKEAKDFLDITSLKVISDLQSKEIIANSSRIVYGSNEELLPEHLNGLGYMNILYLLLQIKIKKTYLEKQGKAINLLFIEEPEAHTHPQMQYVFIERIEKSLREIPNLQTFITTHSPHIVKKGNFKTIRYFKEEHSSVKIKNFYSELEKMYTDESNSDADKIERDNFKFLNQYLSIQSAELFFAEKIIFIEGTAENIMLPYFIKKYDDNHIGRCSYSGNCKQACSLSSQNISILEVGANAKAFRHFITFLGIKTLIITDIDSTKFEIKPGNTKGGYASCSVKEGTHTSNATIRYFFNSPEFENKAGFATWFLDLKTNQLNKDKLIYLAYQTEEAEYHARSFEDSFLNVNFDLVKSNIDHFKDIKNFKAFKKSIKSGKEFFEQAKLLTEAKSGFAFAALWIALTEDIEWKTPKYIEEGLSWIVN